jgi:hypothetical protein
VLLYIGACVYLIFAGRQFPSPGLWLSQMQEKHLSHVVACMGYLMFRCHEVSKHGDHSNCTSTGRIVIITLHRLPASGQGSFSFKLVRLLLQTCHVQYVWRARPHQECSIRATEDALTTLERLFLSKWHSKHQASFRYCELNETARYLR